MKHLIKKICTLSLIVVTWWLSMVTFAWNFWIALEEWVDTNQLGQWVDVLWQMDDSFIGEWAWWAEWIRDFLGWIALEVLIPVFVFAGIIFAMIWFFKLMSATTDEEVGKASMFLLWWVIGIMIMLSAWYLVDQLVWIDNPWEWGVIWMITWWESSWWAIAGHIYDNLFFPFLRMFIYVIIWIMFIFACFNAYKYIFNSDESTKSKSLISLSYAAAGIAIIILAKTLVEAVYGTYSSVTDWETNLWEVWQWALWVDTDFTVLYNIINWTLWLVTFIIVITIIYQWYLLLVMPSDEKVIEKLKKDFWYIFIWILIIGFAYLLVNFFIVQKA